MTSQTEQTPLEKAPGNTGENMSEITGKTVPDREFHAYLNALRQGREKGQEHVTGASVFPKGRSFGTFSVAPASLPTLQGDLGLDLQGFPGIAAGTLSLFLDGPTLGRDTSGFSLAALLGQPASPQKKGRPAQAAPKASHAFDALRKGAASGAFRPPLFQPQKKALFSQMALGTRPVKETLGKEALGLAPRPAQSQTPLPHTLRPQAGLAQANSLTRLEQPSNLPRHNAGPVASMFFQRVRLTNATANRAAVHRCAGQSERCVGAFQGEKATILQPKTGLSSLGNVLRQKEPAALNTSLSNGAPKGTARTFKALQDSLFAETRRMVRLSLDSARTELRHDFNTSLNDMSAQLTTSSARALNIMARQMALG